MKPISQYISAVLATLMSVALCGCGSDKEPPSPESEMSISFRVETRNEGESNAGTANGEPSTGYEDATAWENYIDIDNGDYRIAFFDYDNRCITPFTPTTIEAVDKTTYVDYTLTGQVPGILTFYSNFKIIVVANWGPTNYPEIKSGVTTIDQLCCPADPNLGRFEHFESADYQIGPDQSYVPMYGVKEYKGVQFGIDKDNNTTVLYEGGNFGPVNMLRAVAKVEVEFDTEDDYELLYNSAAKTNPLYITRYNDYGYCAPEDCYLESDYYHSAWLQDYRQGWLHLVGGKNDPTQTERPLNMIETTTSDNKKVWVAYLPEYRNLPLTGNKTDCKFQAPNEDEIIPARIAVSLKTHTGYIDFATYTDGEPGAKMNIERNNLYRFTITNVDQRITWKVEALPWNGLLHEEIVM